MTSDPDHDGLPDYLDREQIVALGLDPDELVHLGVEPVAGHDGRPCWPREQVLDWLNGSE
jgi:hypothetical protein